MTETATARRTASPHSGPDEIEERLPIILQELLTGLSVVRADVIDRAGHRAHQ